MKKQGAVEKAIRAAERIATTFITLEDDDEDEGCSWCGDLNDKERKSYLNAMMTERELILDDLAALKQQATYFLHPECPLCVDPLMSVRNYFDRASAPQPIIPVPQTIPDSAPLLRMTLLQHSMVRKRRLVLVWKQRLVLVRKLWLKVLLLPWWKRLGEETESVPLAVLLSQRCSKVMLSSGSSWMRCSGQ